MRRRTRVAAAAAGSLVIAAGAFAAITLTAKAQTEGSCSSTGLNASCEAAETIGTPASVSAIVTSDPSDLPVEIAWTADCTLNGSSDTTTGSLANVDTPINDVIGLPYSNPDSCIVTATGSLTGDGTTGEIVVTLSFTTATPSPSPSPTATASPSPSPSPSPTATSTLTQVTGFDGMCMDDAGNKSGNWNKIQIWPCFTPADQAQYWTYSGGELIHNGMCANDSGWGGDHSKVILWTCNGAGNELWEHTSYGEYVMEGNGYRYCLDDPGYSTRPGTALIVYTCNNGSNQHWSAP
jgi:Ricin-type beta-trefoil lectin domain